MSHGLGRASIAALLRVVVTVLLVAAVASMLAESAPGSAAERAAAAAGVVAPDDARVPAALRRAVVDDVARDRGATGSAGERVWASVRGAPTLDFGTSWIDRRPVRAHLRRTAPPTLELVLLSLVVALALGIGVALVAARRPGSAGDALLGAAAAVAVSLPPVWLGLLLLRTLAAGEPWRWFPIDGMNGVAGLVLPVVTLALVPAFVVARHARAELVAARNAPWAVAARARGCSEWRVLARHALRAQAGALAPLLVALTAYLLGASVVVERLFGLGGLGSALLDAAGRGDQPVIVGASVVYALVIALASAAVDLGRRALDPRAGGIDAA